MKILTVPGTLNALGEVARYVVSVAQEAGLPAKVSYGLRLAVDEIATNIVTHGYLEAGRSGLLRITAEWNEEQLAIHLEDEGVYYDPRQCGPPDVRRPAAQRQAGGLGVYLALCNVDRFDYERVGDHNRSTFIVQRPAG